MVYSSVVLWVPRLCEGLCLSPSIYDIDLDMNIDINIDIVCPVKVGVMILADKLGPRVA